MDIDLDQLRKPLVGVRSTSLNVRGIYIESGAVEHLVDILENYQNPVILCDSNTRAAAEPFLEEEFKDYPIIELKPKKVRADKKTIKKVLEQIEFCERGCTAVCVDILIVIGAGALHDVAGYCAKEYGIEYVSIPTAASMDDLLSQQVMIDWKGEDRLVPAAEPVWILADTDILTKAPAALTEEGISLVVSAYRAWKSGEIGADLEDENARDMIHHALRDVDRAQDDIRNGAADDMEKLMYGLLVCSLIR